MAALYGERLKRRVCIHCEKPAGEYMRCIDCRKDQAKYASKRRITMGSFTVEQRYTST